MSREINFKINDQLTRLFFGGWQSGSGGVNNERIKYYNLLINELLNKGHDSSTLTLTHYGNES